MKHILKIVSIIYVVLFLGSLIPWNLGFLNLFKKGVKDYEPTDLIFSKLKNQSDFDERIVIVNVGIPERQKLTEAIDKTLRSGAKVVGVDIVFEELKSSSIDSALASIVKGGGRMVLADEYQPQNTNESPHVCNPLFCDVNNIGFINFVAKPNHAIRYFSPHELSNGKTIDAFSVAIVKRYDTEAYRELKQRDKSVEEIFYRGDANSYTHVNIDQIISTQSLSQIVKDKIVLFGYLGADEWTLSARDKFYTPLNQNVGGKSLPDMYGVVVHANVISMLLDRKYINELPKWLNHLFNFILIVGLVAVMRKFFLAISPGYFKGMRFVQLGIFFLLFALLAALFYYKGIRINLTAALVGVVLSWDVVKIYQHIIVNKQKLFRSKS